MDKHFLKIAITPECVYPDEAAAIQLALAEGGFDFVHIRKPNAPEETIANLLEEIDPSFHERLTLHDQFSLALKYKVGGLHLNSRNPYPLSDWNGRLSKSCHTPQECLENTDLDYVTLSPVFPSISKPGYGPDFDSATIASLLAQTERPRIVALGGVTTHLLGQIKELGFDGAAMLGAAWNGLKTEKFNSRQFSLQFITHPLSADDALGQVKAALDGGCRWVQLRWKEVDDDLFLLAARKIQPLCREKGAVFILNDRVHLVEAAQADGVHIGKNDMEAAIARHVIGNDKIIGRTANTVRDIIEGFDQGADYIGMGPFRFTSTKKNLSPVLGQEGYAHAVKWLAENGLTIPIVAIGGITAEDIPQILSTGVEGIAVSGVIASSPHPSETTSLLRSSIDCLTS